MRKLAMVVVVLAVVAFGALMAFTGVHGGGGSGSSEGSRVLQGPALGDSLTAPTLAAGDTAGLPGPRQPVFFRHDIHAGQYKIQCQYCHFAVDANAAGEPIEWERVHALARHAHFPHMRHVKAMGPNACMTCHGDVARMPQVFQANNISNMGWCITCHLESNVTRDCSVCHY